MADLALSNRTFYIHNPVENLVVGTIGEPGEREFFIQVSSKIGLTTIAIEKNQLEVLIERLEELLRELKRQKLASSSSLSATWNQTDSNLSFPVTEDFQAGIMGITWDPENEKISLEIQEHSDQEEFRDLVQIDTDTSEFEFPPAILQGILEISQIREFIKLAVRVIEAGREPCPFCGLPINLKGHLCPRSNGYKR